MKSTMLARLQSGDQLHRYELFVRNAESRKPLLYPSSFFFVSNND